MGLCLALFPKKCTHMYTDHHHIYPSPFAWDGLFTRCLQDSHSSKCGIGIQNPLQLFLFLTDSAWRWDLGPQGLWPAAFCLHSTCSHCTWYETVWSTEPWNYLPLPWDVPCLRASFWVSGCTAETLMQPWAEEPGSTLGLAGTTALVLANLPLCISLWPIASLEQPYCWWVFSGLLALYLNCPVPGGCCSDQSGTWLSSESRSRWWKHLQYQL